MFIDYYHLSFAEGKKLEDVKCYDKFGERQKAPYNLQAGYVFMGVSIKQ